MCANTFSIYESIIIINLLLLLFYYYYYYYTQKDLRYMALSHENYKDM